MDLIYTKSELKAENGRFCITTLPRDGEVGPNSFLQRIPGLVLFANLPPFLDGVHFFYVHRIFYVHRKASHPAGWSRGRVTGPVRGYLFVGTQQREISTDFRAEKCVACCRCFSEYTLTQSRRSPNDFDRQEPAKSGHSAVVQLSGAGQFCKGKS